MTQDNGGSDASPQELTLDARTLAGDLRDRLLGHLRGWRKAPHELSEEQQRGLIAELEAWAAEDQAGSAEPEPDEPVADNRQAGNEAGTEPDGTRRRGRRGRTGSDLLRTDAP